MTNFGDGIKYKLKMHKSVAGGKEAENRIISNLNSAY